MLLRCGIPALARASVAERSPISPARMDCAAKVSCGAPAGGARRGSSSSPAHVLAGSSRNCARSARPSSAAAGAARAAAQAWAPALSSGQA